MATDTVTTRQSYCNSRTESGLNRLRKVAECVQSSEPDIALVVSHISDLQQLSIIVDPGHA